MQFVCWLWRGHGFWKQTARYGEQHVAVLASMLRRHGGHSLTCVTDGPLKIEGVETIAMPPEIAALPDYLPKLWAWSPEFHALIGKRFVSIDLDVVLLADVAPDLQTSKPFRIWAAARNEPYNSSLFVLEPDFGQEVWARYSPERLAVARDAAPYWTGDQSWIAHILGDRQETFAESTGIIRYRPALHDLEPDAKAVFFCGPYDPAIEREQIPWISRNWA